MTLGQFESLWNTLGAWPDYTQAMRRLLPGAAGQAESRWLQLPGLCCQAAGGEASWAGDLASAWGLYYLAAQAMDRIEDADPLEENWAALSPGAILNAASGLYFTAAIFLNRLHLHPIAQPVAVELTREFYSGFLVMGAGQHRDLTTPAPSLEQYWQTAAAKSGSFFALACRLGARLSTSNPAVLNSYSRFGEAVGLLIQMQDDLEDVQSAPSNGRWTGLNKTLPAVYAASVLPSAGAERLKSSLERAPHEPRAAAEALDLIEASGAALYLAAESERQRGQAEKALDAARALPAPREKLLALLPSLFRKQ